MIQATSTTFAPAAEGVVTVRRVRIHGSAFWVLFAVEALLIIACLLAISRMLPALQPVSAAPDYSVVRSAVLQRVNGEVLDPLIDVAPSLRAPASSVRGFSLHGTTYYYYFEGRTSFDPLSRKQISANRTRIVLRDSSGDVPLVIYTLVR